ncbi:YybH family protein [Mucilaginibacter gotjawali]|uniref:Uncharacterized protein n=3 Tax=Mucilaginibacter gotjawali TaxID=1550579 RepID=A0A110B3K1_9SPHI|nr:nuclear transport factor 2 family protein [Mucilaginibacter gotjawali]MBB3057805.1 uncharacterized protein (TIGR02246 family) [Mucilaginibacter gotjawali]BAU52607.1 hypothetical protein MgSA37_00769 [Mucilaginibacter gotjawali]
MYYKKGILAVMLLLFAFATTKVHAQATNADAATAQITAAMDSSAAEWNKGDLESFMNLYDPSATMMMPSGPVGLDAIRALYVNKYFNGKMPKQNLRYSDMKVRLLGDNYALLTGAFTLYGNNLPDRSGRYSLVMIHTKYGWKILHDHSG